MTPFTHKLVKAIWYFTAGCIILFASLIAILRAVTPLGERYKQNLAEYASQLLKQPVSIHQINFSWYGFSPEVTLEDVTVWDPAQKKIALLIQHVDLLINPWRSLLHRQLIPNRFIVDGLQLDLSQLHQQQTAVTTASSDLWQRLAAWLLAQDKIVLEHISVKVPLPAHTFLPINDLHLELFNDNNRHQLQGEFSLAQRTPTRVKLIAKLQGDPQHPSNWNGKIYLSADDMLVSQWLNSWLPKTKTVHGGKTDFQVWMQISNSQWKKIQLQFNLQHLLMKRAGMKSPLLVQNAGGNFMLDRTSANTVKLAGDHIDLHFDGIKFSNMQMSTALVWQQFANNQFTWLVNALEIDDNELHLKGLFRLDHQKNLPHDYISLGLQVELPHGNAIFHYLPTGTLSPGFNAWLTQALNSTGAISGSWIWQGDPALSPGTDPKGLWQIILDTDKMTLHFAPNWPSMTDLNLHMRIYQNDMRGWFDQTHLGPLTLNQAQVHIPLVMTRADNIYIKGNITGHLSDGVQVLMHSPLRKQLHVLPDWHPQGMMNADLKLNIPTDPAPPVLYDATLHLNNASIEQPRIPLTLQQINGDLAIENTGISANQLTAKFFQQQAQLQVKPVTTSEHYPATQVDLDSQINMRDLWQHAPEWFAKNITGLTSYHAQVTLPMTPGHSVRVKLQSNLEGIAINLPSPIGKAANIKSPININLDDFPDDHLTLAVKYPALFNAVTSFDNQQQFINTMIVFGSEKAVLPSQPGVWIRGLIPYFKLQDWQPLLQYSTQGVNTLSNLKQFDLQFDKLNLFNYTFNKQRLQLTQHENNTVVHADGPQFTGIINWPRALGNSINARLQHLQLLSNQGNNQEKNSVTPQSIPPLDLQIKQLQINALNFGEVTLLTSPAPKACVIKQLTATTDAYQLDVHGVWKQSGKQQKSQIQGGLDLRNLAQALQQWGQVPVISGKSGQLQMDLTWPGSPYDLDFAKVNGELQLHLHNGIISHLSPSIEDKVGIGKLVTLLSLRSMPRRLRLDFSDITRPGLSFDNLTGTFNFVDGTLFTNNTSLSSTVTGVRLKGQVNFANKSCNLIMTVLPHVTSSLPILATIAGGPIVGAAAFVANKLFQPELNRATGKKFLVSGPWSTFTVTPIKKNQTQRSST